MTPDPDDQRSVTADDHLWEPAHQPPQPQTRPNTPPTARCTTTADSGPYSSHKHACAYPADEHTLHWCQRCGHLFEAAAA